MNENCPKATFSLILERLNKLEISKGEIGDGVPICFIRERKVSSAHFGNLHSYVEWKFGLNYFQAHSMHGNIRQIREQKTGGLIPGPGCDIYQLTELGQVLQL